MTGHGTRRLGPARLMAGCLALLVAACADPAPPPPSAVVEPPAEPYALACWGVLPADCGAVAVEGLARLPDDAAPAAAVGVSEGRMVVALADGVGSSAIAWSVEAGVALAFAAWEAIPAARIVPASRPDRSQVIALTLGHCGLASPIDVDGALWDPHGPIPAGAPEVINAAEGEFRRTGDSIAMFVTRTGVRVDLRRHLGAGSYQLCD